MEKYFDVISIGPSGHEVTHANVPAENEWDAAKASACMLSYNTDFHPVVWKIKKVTLSENQPS